MYFISKPEMHHSVQMEEINELSDYKAESNSNVGGTCSFQDCFQPRYEVARPYIGIRAV
jgi:hypothetical protein